MGLKGKAKRAASTAVGVSLATSGLSNCTNIGGVDPPPPPFQCDDLADGQTLQASAERDSLDLEITIESLAPGRWLTATVENPVNMQVVNVERTQDGLGPVVVDFTLDNDSVKTASFDFVGQAEDTFGAGGTCMVTRTFNVQLDAVTVSLKQAEVFPLEARQPPEIVVLGRTGRQVHLQAQSTFRGPREIAWTATAGTVLDAASPASPAQDRITWQLPDAPGIHQIEVVMDYGRLGIGFDVLRLEVSSDE